MSFRRLATWLAFLAVFAMAVRVSVDTDTWWHLRAGAWMVEHREILHQDVFSLTRMGQPWVYPGWLAQIALFATYSWLGYAGLNLFTACCVLVAFAMIWRTLEGPVLLRVFVVVIAAVTSAVYWSARPQILSFALAGVYVWALERAQAGERRWLWLLPPAMALWANLHGGFAIGFLLLAVYLGSEIVEIALAVVVDRVSFPSAWRERRGTIAGYSLAMALCVPAVAINPHGPVMLLYPFKTVSIGVLQEYIQEWQSPNFHRLEAQPFLWMLFLWAAALALSRRPRRAIDLVGPMAFAYLGLLAGRNIALFALATAPVLARHAHSAAEPLLSRIGPGRQVPERIARALNAAIFVLLVLGTAAKVSLPIAGSVNEEAMRESLPAGAVEWILEHRPAGPMFNSYNWGGYVLWALYPDYPSFVDGRTDLFDDETLREYLAAWRGEPSWEEVFERWGIRLALLEPGAPLVLRLESAGWERLYADSQAIVLGEAR